MVIYQSLGVGKQILTQRSFFLKQKAILHKAFERVNNERVNSLLFFRSCLCRHILQNPREKATHFKKSQTTNSSINLTPLLQTILNCSVFVLVIFFFFVSHWAKDLFPDFPGAKVYTKLQHIRLLPSPKSTAFHSCLLTHSFHMKTD